MRSGRFGRCISTRRYSAEALGHSLSCSFPLLVFVFKLHPVMKLMLAYSSIYLLLWLVTTQANRYLIPVLPMLSLLCIGLLFGFLEAKTVLQRACAAS